VNDSQWLRQAEEARLPQDMRIRLGHALVEYTAHTHKLRLLHIKGYAVDPGLYPAGRRSSDIDVLVHPADVDALIDLLKASGWNRVTGFKSGSLFQHAATLWHDSWGYIDVHRDFPGVGAPPAEFFDELWTCRKSRDIADVSCTVPAAEHQALLVVLHAGRDSTRGASDVSHLQGTLSVEAWQGVQSEANRFAAELAFAAATGRLAEHQAHPEHDVWAAISTGSSRLELLLARARAANTISSRIVVVASALQPNRDHLRMTLHREPKLLDYLRDLSERVRELWSGMWSARKQAPLRDD
jgi:hypothetical protein